MSGNADSSPSVREALSARIKRLREEAALSKAELARQVGTSDVTIGYGESGEITQIGHQRLLALAGALEVTVSELIDDPAWRLQQEQARHEGVRQGAMMALAALNPDGTIPEKALEALCLRNSEAPADFAANYLEHLADGSLNIPGLHEALGQAQDEETASDIG